MPGSRLVESLTFQQDGTTRLTTTRSYDTLNRLLSIVSSNGTAGIVSSHAYQYNSANQRTNATLADGSRWQYGYDKLGQVTSGRKYWPDGAPVAGEQFDYSFDDIGNRKFAGKGGDQWGANLRYENYTANSLNQYASRTVPGGVDILGAANSNATVTILTGSNGVAATLPGAVPAVYATSRKSEYFRGEAWVNNSTGAVWLTLTNSAVLQTGTNDLLTNFTGNVLVPKTPEVFAYDADGNLTNDGRWSYVWDAENRLVRMVSRTDTPTNAWQALNFAYDSKGRRISKVGSNWNGSAWTKTTDVRFVYDGWNLLAILNPQSSIVQSFVWALDLSGTLEGAGGVGGLLQVTVHSGSNVGAYVCAYDGNGNVMALVNAANGIVPAQYEQGPFAEPIRGTGALAKDNWLSFSTKFQDNETDLLYYGYRYYNPSIGRWLSRDPVLEHSFKNLQADRKLLQEGFPMRRTHLNQENSFAANDPQNTVDLLGLTCPENTCDSWSLAVRTVNGAGAIFNVVAVNAELKAHRSCCMTNYVSRYAFIGGGLGASIKFSMTISTDEGEWFDTKCIPWGAHNGLGRVSTWGIGIGATFGALWAHTPQTYQYFAGTSYGLDASIVTSVGYWSVQPGMSAPLPL